MRFASGLEFQTMIKVSINNLDYMAEAGEWLLDVLNRSGVELP
jgi:hypothetical protein